MGILTITNSPGTTALTSFTVSATTGDACASPDLSPYSITYYHNGAGAYPVTGDSVYSNGAGTTAKEILSPNNLQMGNTLYLQTSVAGVMEAISCP